jgi:TRAP-type C4-dicarboxylate transport system substrate-binding protein
MIQKFYRFTVSLLTQIILLAGLPTSSLAAEGASLRLSTSLPSDHIVLSQVLQPFADRIAEETKAQVSIRIFNRGDLGRNSREQLALLDEGTIDLALIVPSVAEGRFPEMGFVALPNLIPDATTGSRLLTEMYFDKQKLSEGRSYFERVIPIGFFVTPPTLLHSSQEISKLEDIKGLGVWTGNREIADILEIMGAEPETGLRSSDIFTAVSSGSITSAAMNWEQYRGLKAYEVMRYSLDVNLGGSTPVLLVMDRRRFYSLPGYQQDAILRAGGHWLAERWGLAYDRESSRIRGSQLNTLDAADIELFTKYADEMHNRWKRGDSERTSAYEIAEQLLSQLLQQAK